MHKTNGKFGHELTIDSNSGYVEITVEDNDHESSSVLIFPGQIDGVIEALQKCRDEAAKWRDGYAQRTDTRST